MVVGRYPPIRTCWRRSRSREGTAHRHRHDGREIYFQCARVIVRPDLWNPDKRVYPKSLPTPGQILADMSQNRVDGEEYDGAWPERSRQSLW